MFSEFFEKLSSFGDHHQTLVAMVVAFCIICISWGIEQLLEYFFPKHPLYGYAAAVAMGLTLLWITKHFILHVW